MPGREDSLIMEVLQTVTSSVGALIYQIPSRHLIIPTWMKLVTPFAPIYVRSVSIVFFIILSMAHHDGFFVLFQFIY